MKTVRMFFMLGILACIAAGCGSAEIQYPDTYVFGQDSQYQYINKSRPVPGCIAEAPNGYYFLSGPSNTFLYFFDKQNNKAVPVCSKPECLHADNDDPGTIAHCNAFLAVSAKYLLYYGNSLYYVATIVEFNAESGMSEIYDALYQVSLDGTQRREILKLKGVIGYLEIHRGFVYYSFQDYDAVYGEDSATKTKYRLFRYPLGQSGAEPELLDEGKGFYAQILNIMCYGNDVFYWLSYSQDNSLEDPISIIKKYNIQTGTVTPLLEFSNSKFVRMTVFNGQIVYSFGNGTFACDFNGENRRKIDDRYCFCSANRNLLFLDNAWDAEKDPNGHTLKMIDTNWNEVKTISLAFIKNSIDTMLGCSDEYCFIPDNSNSNEFGPISRIYGIPVDKGADAMEPVLLHEWVPKVPDMGVVGQ